MATTQPVSMPAVQSPQNGHPDAATVQPRGSWQLGAGKSGFQKRIDKLIRERHALQAQIGERDQKIAALLAESAALRQELEVMRGWKVVALRFREVFNGRGKQHG